MSDVMWDQWARVGGIAPDGAVGAAAVAISTFQYLAMPDWAADLDRGVRGHRRGPPRRRPCSTGTGRPERAGDVLRPVTLNTTTKWAADHADTLALGLITEALGLPLPVVALPYINSAQAQHPALAPAVATLRKAEVRYLLDDGQDDGGFTPHPPKLGRVEAYPWGLALDVLDGFTDCPAPDPGR
ncbi:flavoprotein [Streptomyces sp. NPDC093514]|uniref:flavoprotein n=1 Tax=Streptomyces sp. NPDC093514 TaxID=3366039 RepID=UPI0038187547